MTPEQMARLQEDAQGEGVTVVYRGDVRAALDTVTTLQQEKAALAQTASTLLTELTAAKDREAIATARAEQAERERDDYRRICIDFADSLCGAGRAGMIDDARLLRAVWDHDKMEKAFDALSVIVNPKEWVPAEDLQQAEATTRRLEAERDMLRGVGCCEAKEGEPASGPCGVCVKCLKSEARRLREALEGITELLQEEVECDCPPEWPRCAVCRARLKARCALGPGGG